MAYPDLSFRHRYSTSSGAMHPRTTVPSAPSIALRHGVGSPLRPEVGETPVDVRLVPSSIPFTPFVRAITPRIISLPFTPASSYHHLCHLFSSRGWSPSLCLWSVHCGQAARMWDVLLAP
ncbi:hypothetical protein C8Q70DRAFT_406107 [Cubamyces menziesii]|nr:hypothetical protein C8Q70DRAFT_406107 [Cubamyces menziesii]